MSGELKPCPFCGKEMHFVPTERPKGWRVGGMHANWCPFTLLTHNECDTYVSKDSARVAWNRRAQPAGDAAAPADASYDFGKNDTCSGTQKTGDPWEPNDCDEFTHGGMDA